MDLAAVILLLPPPTYQHHSLEFYSIVIEKWHFEEIDMRAAARKTMCFGLAAFCTAAFAHAQDAPSSSARDRLEARMRAIPQGDDESRPPHHACFYGVCAQPEREIAATLVRLGPQHGDCRDVDKPSAVGFVRNSWPVVVDFESEPGTFTVLRVKLYHRRRLLPYFEVAFQQVIDPDGTGGRQAVVVPRLDLAGNTGAGVRVARYDIRSFRLADGELVRHRGRLVRAPVAVYGMGAGPHAVGSMTLRNVRFLSPPTIRVPAAGNPQAVSFGYTLDRDFDAVAAIPRFCNPRCADQPRIGPLPRSRSVQATGRWTFDHRARPGSYEMDVRAWLQCGGASVRALRR